MRGMQGLSVHTFRIELMSDGARCTLRRATPPDLRLGKRIADGGRQMADQMHLAEHAMY